MTERDTMRELRVLVATRDSAGLVARLGSDLAVDSLQLAGDGLLAALADRTEGAPGVAREMTARLRERAWDGDEELAMVLFIEQLKDEAVADRLSIANTGRGAFRRFKDTLSRWPDLLTEFHTFSDERQRGRARDWLAAHGYRPTPSAG